MEEISRRHTAESWHSYYWLIALILFYNLKGQQVGNKMFLMPRVERKRALDGFLFQPRHELKESLSL